MRHAYYRVRYALHVHLGKNDFPMVGCSRRYVGDERREREDERGREKGKVRRALRDHLGKNDFPMVGCSKACAEGKGEGERGC